ncbi:MAG TPA: twin-arginine translocation pathway signal protein [Noviherbaspirillum sp.]|nr:twin-arginine translocation pathway signal protein [Noviherbaspirillum sp.]
MNRRNFIRVAGGGVVLAAGGLAGCSTTYPEEAVAAWRGPSPSADVRRWALGYAILAPNSHNLQPWLVDLRDPDAIVLHVDRERLLPMTDPWYRQIMVSQGTFLEALAIALRQRGLEPKFELFPQGEPGRFELDGRPVARITWQPGAAPDPLFAQLLKRHTAKGGYDTGARVDPRVLAALAESLQDNAVQYGYTVEREKLSALSRLALDASKVELDTPRTILESVRLTRVGPAEIARHRDGISVNNRIARLADMLGAFDRDAPLQPGSAGYRQTLAQFEEQTQSAMGFVWLSTATAQHLRAGAVRSAEVRAGRAYMRLQLKATELGLQMHPMSQALQEFDEMRPHYMRLHRLLLGAQPEQQTLQMFCRVGYGRPSQPAPRRGVDAIIRA